MLANEQILVLKPAAFANVDIRVRVSGGGHTSQVYAIRQAIGKAIVAYTAKYEDAAQALELKKALVSYDRTLLVADPRRCEPKKFGGPGARARYQKSCQSQRSHARLARRMRTSDTCEASLPDRARRRQLRSEPERRHADCVDFPQTVNRAARSFLLSKGVVLFTDFDWPTEVVHHSVQDSRHSRVRKKDGNNAKSLGGGSFGVFVWLMAMQLVYIKRPRRSRKITWLIMDAVPNPTQIDRASGLLNQPCCQNPVLPCMLCSSRRPTSSSVSLHPSAFVFCSACFAFRAPASGMAPLHMIQFKPTALTGTFRFSAISLITDSKGSSSSMG